MSRKAKEDYYRFFSVTDPRTHEKGHTEYKVTARFVSKTKPEDVKEVVVWKRYSELKKLHSELAYTHRNLFRRQEEFPPFPRAQLFGRFDEAVIEERRSASEAMLLFCTNIPALYNSPQLKDFFRAGEVKTPLDPPLSPTSSLPPPLIPLPESDVVHEEEEVGAQILSQELDSALGEPEMAEEAYSETERNPTPAPHTEATQPENAVENTGFADQPKRESSPAALCVDADQSECQEEFDLLFDSVGEGFTDQVPPPLSDTDLAVFDPCAKEELNVSHDHSELLSLPLTNPNDCQDGEAGYLSQAANELKAALEREKKGEYGEAILRYRSGVDILIRGVQGDPDPQRRDSVKRRTVQYLEHAESLLSLHTHSQSGPKQGQLGLEHVNSPST